jgi:hypothetical protein
MNYADNFFYLKVECIPVVPHRDNYLMVYSFVYFMYLLVPYNAIPQLDMIYKTFNVFIPQQTFQSHSFEHITYFFYFLFFIFLFKDGEKREKRVKMS